MPIRVLHLIGSLRLGGAQVVVRQLAENADPSQVETWIYPLRPANVQIPIRGPVITLDYPNYDPRKFFAIGRLCREHRIDLIHAHLHKPILGALLAGPRLGIPVIVHEHGPVCRAGMEYAAYRQLLKRLWPRAAAVIAISRDIEQILTGRIGIARGKIRLLPNAADFSAFDQCTLDRRAARGELNLPDSALVLGYVGRLSRVKGVDILLDMMRHLVKDRPESILLIAGDGEEGAALRGLCEKWNLQDHVRLLGFTPDVRPVMAASDIALVPSRQEPFGIAALEWMRMRVPLVTSGAGGLGELVTDGHTGWIVPENTPSATLGRIMQVLENQTAARQITQHAFELTKNYELKPYLEKMYALYRDVLAHS